METMAAIDRAAFLCSFCLACGWRRAARHHLGDLYVLARVARVRARA